MNIVLKILSKQFVSNLQKNHFMFSKPLCKQNLKHKIPCLNWYNLYTYRSYGNLSPNKNAIKSNSKVFIGAGCQIAWYPTIILAVIARWMSSWSLSPHYVIHDINIRLILQKTSKLQILRAYF